MPDEDIGVVLIGCGRAGGIHVRSHRAIPGVEIRAFVDPVLERAERLARESGLDATDSCYQDLDACLVRTDVDVVACAAPVRLHCDIALRAFAAGKHVLMEKPLAESLAEADQMIDAARDRGVLLGQIFQNHFNRTPRRIQALLESGHLGTIARARVYSQTIHGYDTILWLFGDPVRVYAEWPGELPDFRKDADLDRDVEDYGARLNDMLKWSAVARFPDGTVGVLQSGAAWNSIPQVFPFQTDHSIIDIVGERMAVIFTIWNQNVQFRMGPDRQGGHDRAHFAKVQQWFETLYPEGSDTTGHGDNCADFYSALREGRKPLLTGEDGRRTVELFVAVYKSAREHAVAELPIERDDPMYEQMVWPNI